MNEENTITLFNRMYPNFFESEAVRELPDSAVYHEMLMKLEKFDASVYDKKLDGRVSFGFYKGGTGELKKAVEMVDDSWVDLFDGENRVFCGYFDKSLACFCLIDDMGTYRINGCEAKIGGPGCVGTLPEYRNKGIGLTMVKYATQLLREEKFDYSYIHFTHVNDWYGKLGYKTSLSWNKCGIIREGYLQ